MDGTIIDALRHCDYELASMLAFIEVETGGRGFDTKTGKILIQFEPSWFRKKAPYAPSGKWSVNRVDVQAREWEAFNNAFKLNPTAAMESTSIGLAQIMGFHYERLGYASVGKMWDDAKTGIEAQVRQLVKFIDTDAGLADALRKHDWARVARLYNGAGYKTIARKYMRVPYDEAMRNTYIKYRKESENDKED